MRGYIYLIEVRYQSKGPGPHRWNVVEASTSGSLALVGQYRWFFLASWVAAKAAKRLLDLQGENLRLEVHQYDEKNEMVSKHVYGKDPRSRDAQR